MLGLSMKLLQWSLLRNRIQLMIMVLAVVGSLSSYVLLGTALHEMSDTVVQLQRTDWPFDLAITGNLEEADQEQIAKINGIRYLESIVLAEAYFFSGEQTFLMLPPDKSRIIIELESGILPLGENDIVIPSDQAMALHLSLGDEVRILPEFVQAEVQVFKVCGILSSKQSVVKKPLLSERGVRRLTSSLTLPSTTVMQLDGKVDMDTVIVNLETRYPGLSIEKYQDNYAKTKQDLNMSDSLVLSLRFLILGITATSLAVLLYISQRAGSYQIGVLRAIGVKKAWLLFPAILQTSIIFIAGFFLTGICLPLISQNLGLTATRTSLFLSLVRDVRIYFGVGILSTLGITLQFLGTPIPRLMTDTW